MAILQQDIPRLDIAVHDPLGVREIERFGDLAGDAHDLVQRERPLALQALAEGLSGDERHHIVEQPVGVARVVQRKDVRVGETRGEGDLAEEPVRTERRGELGAQELHSDLACVLEVAAEIDRGHSAAPELALEHVPFRQNGSNPLQHLRHWGYVLCRKC